MAYVQCLTCRHPYRAPMGRSTCPQCERVNVRLGLFDGVSPTVKVVLIAFAVLVALVVVASVTQV